MKLITEKEYRNILNKHEELIELITSKTKQLSLIIYNKLPKGDFITNLDELDEKDGKICVRFESYSCGEPNYDTYYLPLEFLFDESYPEKYKVIYQREQHIIQKEKELKWKEIVEKQKKVLEEYEKKEYEKLKLKFEKDTSKIYPIHNESEEYEK